MKTYNKLNNAVDDIKSGLVGVIPTDTVYGLCADATNPLAVQKMFKIKGRKPKPGTLIAANIDQLVSLGIKKRYLIAVESYWPNFISIIIPTGFQLEYLHFGKQTLAVRIPNQKKLQDFLMNSGPLYTTSANLPDKKPAETLEEAKSYFGDKVDFYVDGGTIVSEPSTIIRVLDDAIEVIREGRVKINEETGMIKNDT